MTPRRWQLAGGYLMGLLYIAVAWALFNYDFSSPLAWGGTLAAGVVGNGIGIWTVRSWQEAGK